MTEEQIALAKRAVACKGWKWMPGMAWFDERFLQYRVQSEAHAVVMHEDRLPDLTDPATLGCLLALVRDAYGDSALYVRLSDTTRQIDGVRAWEVLGWISAERSRDGRGGSWRGWGYASEAEALVAALEAAP